MVPRVRTQRCEQVQQPFGEPDIVSEIPVVHLGGQLRADLPGLRERGRNGQGAEPDRPDRRNQLDRDHNPGGADGRFQLISGERRVGGVLFDPAGQPCGLRCGGDGGGANRAEGGGGRVLQDHDAGGGQWPAGQERACLFGRAAR